MAFTDWTTLRDNVRDAISDIIAGRVKEFRIGETWYTLHNLDDLMKIEGQLSAKVSKESNSSNGRMLVNINRAGSR